MGEVARPTSDLAERINAEHRACEAATDTALTHAMAAGDLLIQAKDGVKAEGKHHKWTAWLAENFEGSHRTANVYMQLARHRPEIEEAKAQSSANLLSIDEALRYIRPGRPASPSERALEARERRKAREEARLLRAAEYAIRTGTLGEIPDDMEVAPGVWQLAIQRAFEERGKNLPNVLDALGHEFDILIQSAPPEQVAAYLTEPVNDSEKAEIRSQITDELQAGADWLARVLEEVEARRGGRASPW